MTDKRKQIYTQIREYADALLESLNTLDSIPPDQTKQIQQAELDVLGKTASVAVMKNTLLRAMNSDTEQ